MGKIESSKSRNHTGSLTGDPEPILILGAAKLRVVLTPELCLKALEDAYRNLHAAPADSSRSIGFQTLNGKFHVKAGLYPGTHKYFAAKINANFPSNPQQNGLPTIQGLIVLCDGADGHPVAILDSGELTGRRTAAATALAAKYGARKNSRTLAVIGSGIQARYQAEAIRGHIPIVRVAVYDNDLDKADGLAAWASKTLGVDAVRARDIDEAVLDSDITITCTTASKPVLMADMVPSGCFIAAVGADNPDKHELDPEMFRNARILVDDIEQCISDGDLGHAIRAGKASQEDISATLAQLATGARPGRLRDDEIVIFDSTGTGLQDVAAAAAAYEAVCNLP